MGLKLLRSALCLLAISGVFMDGAIAQPRPGCVKRIQKDLNSALISVRLSDQDPTLVAVKTNTNGKVTECSVVKGSDGNASCTWVKGHWNTLERCRDQGLQL